MFDFNSLKRPAGGPRPVNPVEIFRGAPALAGTPNDLWQGQSKALEAWHAARTKKDVLISLHTGAGKSLVGLLAAQSLIHEGVPRVLYVCATNDLVIQTSNEVAGKLGFQHTTRSGGEFSNDLYSTGQGFCLTNYQAVFNSQTTFRKDNRPDAIIFDDAHVAEKIIRDCYTLRIERKNYEALYKCIYGLCKPHFQALHKTDYFNNIVAGDSVYRIALVPPHVVLSLSRESGLAEILKDHGLYKDANTRYPLLHLADHLHTCNVFISHHAIEISPAFLPSKRIEFLTDNAIRRLYLSATLTSEVDFCRAFGKRPSEKIEPESDAGIGERLIILGDAKKLKGNDDKEPTPERLATVLSRTHKLLISTASYPAAEKYKKLAEPPTARDFSAKLETFRKQDPPATFVLVGRVDGIDLPHATCRVMLVDGLPSGFSLYETYLFDFLEMRNSFASKLANRVTQMFGRTNRGRNDYSVIFSLDKRLVTWLATPRNIALLPELLRKQLLLGKSLMEQFNILDVESFPSLVDRVVSRDAGWLNYYRDSISGLDLSQYQLDQASDNDVILRDAALAEAEFGAHIWDGNASGAREALGAVVDKVVVADRRLGGWYNIQIGMTYEIEGDGEAAAKQYAEAKSRTNYIIALPVPQTNKSAATGEPPRNQLHVKLLDIFSNDVRVQNEKISRYERRIMPLFDSARSASEHEEALRLFGELLGLEATRPEQEEDTNSTLDVLWAAPDLKHNISFELKTKKTNNHINAEEVGQCHNHLEWSANSHPEQKPLGIIVVGDLVERTKQAAPSVDMWATRVGTIQQLFGEFINLLLALQRMPPLERYAEISAVCARPEWQIDAIFQRLRGVRLLDLTEKA